MPNNVISLKPRAGLRWQTILIILMLMFWEGFPFALFGMPMVFGYQLYAGITFLGFSFYLGRILTRGTVPSAWEWLPLIFFIWCVLVSCNYSVHLFPQVTAAWLPAIFTVSPLLSIFILNNIKANRKDAENSLILLSMIGSTIVIMDHFFGGWWLEPYARGSAFSEGRVVIFKYPLVFGLVLTIMRSLYSLSWGGKWFYALMAMVMAYNVIILTESRLAMGALAVASLPIFIFCVRGGRKLFVLLMGPLVIIPPAIFVINRYFEGVGKFNSYLITDVSASFRQEELKFFAEQFANTYGMGFGFMSGNPIYNNVLTFAAERAGELAGFGSYGMALVDIGLYAALYQFGWVGLGFTLIMTLVSGFVLAGAFRYGRNYAGASACGFLFLAFLLSPMPFNGFTIFASSHVGSLLWFMASQVNRERQMIDARERSFARPSRSVRGRFERG